VNIVTIVNRAAEGSSILGKALGGKLADWCQAGRRNDLKGWNAGLGPLLRAATLVGACIVLAMVLNRHRDLMWLLVGVWIIFALRVPQEESPEEVVEVGEGYSVTDLVRDLIANDEGVHLKELYPAMREEFEELAKATDKELRQVLVNNSLEVSRTTRSKGVAGRSGIRRSSLPLLEDL